MQTQKDEIKNRITGAALDEFGTAGYRHASMRRIARRAGITVGNIYSYFPGKNALFESILAETVAMLETLLSMQIPAKDMLSPSAVEQMTGGILEVYLTNKKQFMILVNKSAGSKYENVKAWLVEHARRRFSDELLPRLKTGGADELLADTIAVALIEGALNIFNKSRDEARLASLLSDFLKIIFSDIYTRL